jgi:hypothetical protein
MFRPYETNRSHKTSRITPRKFDVSTGLANRPSPEDYIQPCGHSFFRPLATRVRRYVALECVFISKPIIVTVVREPTAPKATLGKC